MSQERDTNIALFIDFDNVALGARDARQRFDIKLLMQRLLEKGKILVKKAYADWHYYKEHMSPLHEAAIELIEIPMPRISGKNSADIKLVVDAMELCYSKDHIDTFVIVSGDSDFSPLVSKLRENNKRVVGVGVKNSSSHLLINNCDEFIFYDNIYRDAMGQSSKSVANVPSDKREMFEFLVSTVQSLLQESRGVLYSSLIKDTMTRKMPDFNERSFGYSTFGDMLDDARRMGLLTVERDARAGGTWVVSGLGDGKSLEEEETGTGRSSSRRRRRSGSRRRTGEGEGKPEAKGESQDASGPESGPKEEKSGAEPKQDRRFRRPRAQDKPAEKPAEKPSEKPSEKTSEKPATKKTASKKASVKKTTKKAPAKKTASKKAPAKKTAKKTTAKKAVTKKAPAKRTTKKATAKKAVTKKAPARKTTTRKTTAKKTTAKKTGSRKGD